MNNKTVDWTLEEGIIPRYTITEEVGLGQGLKLIQKGKQNVFVRSRNGRVKYAALRELWKPGRKSVNVQKQDSGVVKPGNNRKN